MKNRDEEMTRKINMEKLRAMPRLLNWLLYGLDVGNYSKVNESNFIVDIDELWIGDNARWYIRSLNSEVTQLFGTANIFKVTLKSYTRLLLLDVYIKLFPMTNHKIVVTNTVLFIAQVFRLTRRSTQQR